MNGEGASQGAPAQTIVREPKVAPDSVVRELRRENERLRVAIQYAIDDLADGSAWSAVDTLSAALEGGPSEEWRCAA